MGNVFVHTLMSLDGFIAGPNDDMSWVFRHAMRLTPCGN
jgi:hypothetical protein